MSDTKIEGRQFPSYENVATKPSNAWQVRPNPQLRMRERKHFEVVIDTSHLSHRPNIIVRLTLERRVNGLFLQGGLCRSTKLNRGRELRIDGCD